jgi:hypothetical protein
LKWIFLVQQAHFGISRELSHAVPEF